VLLVAGAVVLLVSILIGQQVGDRVLLQSEERQPLAGSVITPVPEPSQTDPGSLRDWKRLQVVSIATDPAFPDPRVTPPPPTPRPTPRPTPTPSPTPTVRPYTSPPLPLPLVTHSPEETDEPTSAPVPGVPPS
jgi:hypothetical protein